MKTLDMRFARIDDAKPAGRDRTLERFAEDLGLDLTDHERAEFSELNM